MTTVAELSKLTENKLHDSGKNASQAFWCEEKDIEKMELLQGDHVRLKTKGEGPFIGEICYNVLLLISIIFSWPLFFWYIFFYIATCLLPLAWKQLYLFTLAVSALKKIQLQRNKWNLFETSKTVRSALGGAGVLSYSGGLFWESWLYKQNQERTRKYNEQQIVWAEDGHVPTPCPSHNKCFNHWTPLRQLVSQYPLPWDDEQLLIANHRT